MQLEISGLIFEKNLQISDFMNIRQVGAELFHAASQTDRQKDRCDEASSHFSQMCERA
jgi:hypothetical protein